MESLDVQLIGRVGEAVLASLHIRPTRLEQILLEQLNDPHLRKVREEMGRGVVAVAGYNLTEEVVRLNDRSGVPSTSSL